MDDLRARFDSLDRVIAPDVWDEVERRRAALNTTTGGRPLARVIPGPKSWRSQTPIGRRSGERNRIWWLLAAALIAMALIAGGLLAGGSRLFSLVSPTQTAVSPSQTPVSPSQTVVSPSPSDSGGRTNGLIAYSSNGQIFVAAPDGTNRRALTPAGGNAYQPRWSPDGQQLAFLSLSCAAAQPCDQKASPSSLVVMKPDGSGRQVLEQNLYPILTLEWSPDGTRLALDDASPFGVHVVAVDSHEMRAVGVGESPTWSPDGTTLSYEHSANTHLVTANGTHDRLLLQPAAAGSAVGARWSPDGSQLAFVWNCDCVSPSKRTSDAWLVDASGNSPHRMSEVPDGAIFAGWSPDGRSIVYFDASQANPPGLGSLVVANSDGSGPRAVANRGGVSVRWSPDGTRLLLIEGQADSSTRLVIIDTTGVTPEIEIPADAASWQSLP